MSILLCCLTVSTRNRPKSAVYSPKNESPASEVNIAKDLFLNKINPIIYSKYITHLLVVNCLEF